MTDETQKPTEQQLLDAIRNTVLAHSVDDIRDFIANAVRPTRVIVPALTFGREHAHQVNELRRDGLKKACFVMVDEADFLESTVERENRVRREFLTYRKRSAP